MEVSRADQKEEPVTVTELIAAGIDPGAVARLPIREVRLRGPCWQFQDIQDWLEFEAARSCIE
jgi:hypothetical protein